jgi:hypothetical protein
MRFMRTLIESICDLRIDSNNSFSVSGHSLLLVTQTRTRELKGGVIKFRLFPWRKVLRESVELKEFHVVDSHRTSRPLRQFFALDDFESDLPKASRG